MITSGDEVAKAVSFLASDESSYVNGIELIIDMRAVAIAEREALTASGYESTLNRPVFASRRLTYLLFYLFPACCFFDSSFPICSQLSGVRLSWSATVLSVTLRSIFVTAFLPGFHNRLCLVRLGRSGRGFEQGSPRHSFTCRGGDHAEGVEVIWFSMNEQELPKGSGDNL